LELDLSRFRETFFQEAAEHLESMESALLSLQAGRADGEMLNAIFRSAHSMKAGAATFGFETMTRFTHVLESLLDRMRNGETDVSVALLELLLRSVDVLRSLVDAAAQSSEPPAIWEEVIAELDRALGNREPDRKQAPEAAATPPRDAEYAIKFEPGPELFRLGLDPFLVLRDLAQLGSVEAEADLSRLPALEALDPETCYLGWRLRLETSATPDQIRDAFAFVEDVAAVSIEAVVGGNAAAAAPRSQQPTGLRTTQRETMRVSIEKVDRLIDMVGELVIAQSMAAQIMVGFTPDRLPQLGASMAELERHTRELQDRAMRIRMTPVGTIFSRFPRLVHDTGKALAKQVTLEISGEETELDKGVVERIADPLTHLVRNAVDHGIETPAERLDAGKPAEGSVRLSAYHQGGNVIVELADDGRGLNTDRIRAKGIERGLITSEQEMSADQIHALIFKPGFSTSETVSDMSGRGVGMDVVKKSVDELQGTVAIETERGRGCTVRIKLPLTLAILDGLLLRVGEQTYVMPLVSIVESIRPRPEQVQNLAGRGEVVVVRKHPLPLLRLGRMFGIPAEVTDPARGLVVVVEHDGRQLALLVDELLGQQQVVVKSLETNFRKVDGITGATILGDGRAALILDIAGLVTMSHAA
jgi:two-component system, chemotaxis family, sensor kinase CheA